jgi:hypothetical protein
MSELALGPHGWAMFPAFSSLAIATGGCLAWSRFSNVCVFVQILLVIAACAFVGAGVFRLGTSSEEHVLLIAIAFISMSLAGC